MSAGYAYSYQTKEGAKEKTEEDPCGRRVAFPVVLTKIKAAITLNKNVDPTTHTKLASELKEQAAAQGHQWLAKGASIYAEGVKHLVRVKQPKPKLSLRKISQEKV